MKMNMYNLKTETFYSKTAIYSIEGLSIVCFSSKMAIDADGSPRAYHPDNTGIDDLKQAGHPGNWWGIATDNEQTSGLPVIQTAEDPCPGYFLSTTSLNDLRFDYRDSRRYVNAETIPYFVLPVRFLENIELGDIGWIYNKRNQKHSFAIFADRGPDVGEGSVRLAEKLGINNDPRYGGIDSGILYFVFAGSGKGTKIPLTEPEIDAAGENLMTGIDRPSLVSVFETPDEADKI